ncbi:hypothetical protein [Sneathiella aquimaris]|uniref:hypothetical protein n=1 Tax=Sneathiella aquimaris TaxID=2599305 RepID=UPI00146ED5D4|nr:hypothetical protein [Sneathiella aquimaris]
MKPLTLFNIFIETRYPDDVPLGTIYGDLCYGRSPGETLEQLARLGNGEEAVQEEKDDAIDSAELDLPSFPRLGKSSIEAMVALNSNGILAQMLGGINIWLEECDNLSDQELFNAFMRGQAGDNYEDELNPYENLNFAYLSYLAGQLRTVGRLFRARDVENEMQERPIALLQLTQRLVHRIRHRLPFVLWQNARPEVKENLNPTLNDDIMNIILGYCIDDELAAVICPPAPSSAGPSRSARRMAADLSRFKNEEGKEDGPEDDGGDGPAQG